MSIKYSSTTLFALSSVKIHLQSS